MFRRSRNNLTCWLTLSMGSLSLIFAGVLYMGAQQSLATVRLFVFLATPIGLGVIGLTSYVLAGMAIQPIQQRYLQLERFTADASHELRAPLSVILSNAQVGLLSQSAQEQQHRLQNIVTIAKTMNTLISNLLFLARHPGTFALEQVTPLDLTQHLQTIANQYAPNATTKQLQWAESFPTNAVWVRANPDLLSQAILNLLDNACQYTPLGGRIQLKLFTASQQAIIQVSDTGIGIAQAELSHIFERFYRVETEQLEVNALNPDRFNAEENTAPLRQPKGFGLGLAIVQQIVEAHSGEIIVTSTVGKGSTFEVRLPLARSV